MIASIAHVNLTVHPGTLDDATEFYSQTLGLTPSPVPELQRGTILWYGCDRGQVLILGE